MNASDSSFDEEAAWAAVLRRDRAADGRFLFGVLTTGIYCRPSCAARHASRANVRFFADAHAARAAGLRACRRCLPDEVARDAQAIEKALGLLAGDEPPRLAALAAEVGYAPHHFCRLFKRATGVTPAQYVCALRAHRAEAALRTGGRVTDAIYEAGYSSPSRYYEGMKGRMGMDASAWRKGGAGVTIRWALVPTSLGSMLVAATEAGICRLSFDEGEAELRGHFPNAEIVEGGAVLANLAKSAAEAVETPGSSVDLPLDVRGTAFQEAVWRALSRIPPGETLTYTQLALRAGNPKAVRATGSACGANPVAILIPCHRALRSDGSLGGYAYGLERKIELLKRERV